MKCGILVGWWRRWCARRGETVVRCRRSVVRKEKRKR